MSKNIFDINNISDLSGDCKKQLKNKFADETLRLLDLFERKPVLSISEVIVALYRLYKIVKSRTWVSTTLYNLGQKKLIKRIGPGVYEKINVSKVNWPQKS